MNDQRDAGSKRKPCTIGRGTLSLRFSSKQHPAKALLATSAANAERQGRNKVTLPSVRLLDKEKDPS